MNETITVNDLRFEVRRSDRRKIITITVEREGELIISAPESCSEIELTSAVVRKRFWIYSKLARKELLLKPGRKRDFVQGEGFLYLGRSYRLKLESNTPSGAPLSLTQGRFIISRSEVTNAREHFIEWYTVHAEPWLQRSMDKYRDRIGVEPSGLKVQDLKSRWGSCGRNGTLNFHWRTILLPPRIVEYIVAHELIHLEIPHHTEEFWSRLERAMPDFALRKKWLAENGVSADI